MRCEMMKSATTDTASNIWLSLTDVAAQKGVSKVAIHKRVKKFVGAGMLSTKPGPRGTVLVNIVAFDRLVADETDPAQALRNGGELDLDNESDGVAETVAGANDGPAGKQPGAGSYASARADRESYQAENARLDLEERLDRLTDREEVARRQMDVFRRHRDRLLSIPARLQDRLASADDGQAIRMILTTEIRRELDGLAEKLDALASENDDLELDDDAVDRESPQTEQTEAAA